MTKVFHRHSRQDPPVAVSGEGCYLYDAEGRTYLDGSGGQRYHASAMVTAM